MGLLGWSLFLINRARGELRGGQVVNGLFRTYQPPYGDAQRWVLDPREDSLAHELAQRYGENRDVAGGIDWRKTLDALNLGPRVIKNDLDLKKPSLLVKAETDTPDLWIGRFGLKHVVFRAGTGVILLGSLPVSEQIIELSMAEEKPW